MKVFVGINNGKMDFVKLYPRGKTESGNDLFITSKGNWYSLTPRGRLRKVDIWIKDNKKIETKTYWTSTLI